MLHIHRLEYQTYWTWKVVTERCLCRWYREISVEVVPLTGQPWLLVQNQYSPPLSVPSEAAACSCQEDVKFAAKDRP